MIVRRLPLAIAVALVLALVAPAAAQDGERRRLALELARLMVDDRMRNAVDEQVRRSLVQALATTLQDRLNRRLQEVEWRMLTDIVGRFVRETFPPARIEEIAAGVYAAHFDEAELRALVDFQRSPVGRKASRMTAVIGAETAQAIEREVRRSPAAPAMLSELQDAFPVLGAPQSP